jgi:streptomycin 6-kinase
VPEEELVARWQLTLGDEYPSGAGGRAYRADLPDGTPAVLKIIHPHREAEQEAEALERYRGDGAVRLLDCDETRFVLLLERCEPGTYLAQLSTAEAMDVLVELLPRLWIDPSGFWTVEQEVPYLIADIDSCADPRLKEIALTYLNDLVPSQGQRVLVNQDLHGDNVLAAQREPWLVIDPKPLAAERELQAAPIVRSPELGHSKDQALYRLDRLVDLGLDRERMMAWTIVHTIAWSGGADFIQTHIETVEWLLEEL